MKLTKVTASNFTSRGEGPARIDYKQPENDKSVVFDTAPSVNGTDKEGGNEREAHYAATKGPGGWCTSIAVDFFTATWDLIKETYAVLVSWM